MSERNWNYVVLVQMIADKITHLSLFLNYLVKSRDIDIGLNQDTATMIDMKFMATIIAIPFFSLLSCYSYVSFSLSTLNLFSFSKNNAGISR